MNVIDIIIAIVLVWALVSGLRKGLISQASSFVGLLLGVWLAYKFNGQLAEWIGVDIKGIAAYAILFAAGLLVAWLCSRISGWILRGVGLGALDKIGGAVISLTVYVLLLNLLLGLFRNINTTFRLVDDKVLAESVLVEPVERVAGVVFPYLEEVKDAILESETFGIGEQNKPSTEESKTNEI